MHDIHDRGYEWLFSKNEIFQQLVTTFVTEPWVKELDFSTCELVKDAFVSKEYKASFGDLIYKIKWRGEELYLIVLLEFKSAPEQFVVLQILGYLVDFYRALIASENKARKLPPVFAILLYNGEQAWNVPTDMAELIQGNDALGEYGLRFKYYPIIENAYDKEALLKIGNIVSTLFLAEAHYDIALLKEELIKLFERSPNKHAISLFLNWFKQLAAHGRIEQSDYEALDRVYQDTKEFSMLINNIERDRKQLFESGVEQGLVTGVAKGIKEGIEKGIEKGLEKGLEKGIEKGLEKGRRESNLEFARMMLASGEPLEKIKHYTSLTNEDLERLRAEMAQG